jgi:hypothetical protein
LYEGGHFSLVKLVPPYAPGHHTCD